MNVSIILPQFSEKHVPKLNHKLSAFGSITAMLKYRYLNDLQFL